MGRGFGLLLGVQALLVAALLSAGFWLPERGAALVGTSATLTSPQLQSFATLADVQQFLGRVNREQLQQMEAMEAAADASAPALDIAQPDLPAEPGGTITNVQTAGVDEGGIVKLRGQHLIVLRRGRLFSIDTADGLRTISAVNAFPPGIDGQQAWYDEMLVNGDMVVVIGFNYARAGTEINRFRIDDGGRLTYRDTYTLRSNDYYSSENYASRLIGSELIVYSPLLLRPDVPVVESLPAVARYDAAGRRQGDFAVIADPDDIFVPPPDLARPVGVDVAHGVSRCDLAAATLDCEATVVLGGWSRSFYVGSDAVYVWTQGWAGMIPPAGGERRQPDFTPARVYRLPLDGSAPGVVSVAGMPTDQFSFRADADRLHVLTGASHGDAMWDSEAGGGPMRLLTLPLSRFASGSGTAEAALYRSLPPVQGYGLQNRFVGEHLLYSIPAAPIFDERGIGRTNPAGVVVVPLNGGEVRTLTPGHEVTRIDIMGEDAVVIGNRGNTGGGPGSADAGIGSDRDALHFTTVTLGAVPAIFDRFSLPAASESESRSHAFFYRPDPGDRSGRSGMLGLPIRHDGANPATDRASILYLRRSARRLGQLGQLAAQARAEIDDGCIASCTDWYGNARPIFYGPRIFALLGYELVEGRVEQGAIREVRRLDFAPRGPQQRR